MKECWHTPGGTWLWLVLWQQGHWELLLGAQQDSGEGTSPSASSVRPHRISLGAWRCPAGGGALDAELGQVPLPPNKASHAESGLYPGSRPLQLPWWNLPSPWTYRHLFKIFLFLLCQTSWRQWVYKRVIHAVNLHLADFYLKFTSSNLKRLLTGVIANFQLCNFLDSTGILNACPLRWNTCGPVSQPAREAWLGILLKYKSAKSKPNGTFLFTSNAGAQGKQASLQADEEEGGDVFKCEF